MRIKDKLQMSVDSVAGNVFDLARVLDAVRELAGLRPFLRFKETRV